MGKAKQVPAKAAESATAGAGPQPGPTAVSPIDVVKYFEATGAKDITLKTLEKVLDRQRVVVYGSWAMTAVAVLGIGVLTYLNQPSLIFGSVLVAALIFLGAMLIDRSLTLHDLKQPLPVEAPPATGLRRVDPIWSRLIPALPLPDGKPAELAVDLQNIRNAAYTWLAGRQPAVAFKTEQIRANVFLPDYVNAERGVICMLRMPEELRIGMKGHPDENIGFRPWQGLTGRVFMEQKDLKFAKTSPTADGRELFADFFELTAEQAQSLHPKLRWIVSFPLALPDDSIRKAAGVLNVDGLEHQLSDDDLALLWGELSPRVARFADQLAVLPKVRIMILTEPETHG